ncbi:hypothetical protein [Brevundimonas naejangsanensis]|uniref:hypothetical protein n=1 Tax=Brevundimonas naejangsanensis TaxID=588932 RepID=UPI0032088F4E
MAGYLPVLDEAARQESLGPLHVSFTEFFDRFYLVAGSTAKAPYLLPVNDRGEVQHGYQNPNVAGSYAPSSLRPTHPLHSLCAVEPASSGVTFTLVANHGEIALQLLKTQPLLGASLAAYLYRDFAFTPGSSRQDLYQALKAQFGFAFKDGVTPFEAVFLDNTNDLGTEIFETLGAVS